MSSFGRTLILIGAAACAAGPFVFESLPSTAGDLDQNPLLVDMRVPLGMLIGVMSLVSRYYSAAAETLDRDQQQCQHLASTRASMGREA